MVMSVWMLWLVGVGVGEIFGCLVVEMLRSWDLEMLARMVDGT